ncbi:hypothetical protein Fcan01_16234 [Folsomia candida]|uniref:Uncharacterized protein n=1 Tax=Folsomia candida TaxID=158441 RepID=A0A226DUF7_FOLCA|nr:hypothetical protein Fcan01_16234 [Folsomia candida]
MALANHLKMWQRHRGVESLSVVLQHNGDMQWGGFTDSIVQLFPAVKKFDLKIPSLSMSSSYAVKRMMEPFQIWDLEHVNFDLEEVNKSAVVVEILKNMSLLKGIKRVNFMDVSLTQNDFFPHIQDISFYSAEFQSLKLSGHGHVAKTVELRPLQSGGPIRFTVPEIMGKMRPLLHQ